MTVAGAHVVADVAARLRFAREDAALSIQDLSARTKIKPSILMALEQGAFERVPGGEFFTRAFLRTCARELHLPVDEVMADYDGARPSPVVTEAPEPISTHDRVEDARAGRGGWAVAAVTVTGMLALFAVTRSAPVPESQASALQPVAATGDLSPGSAPTPQATTGTAASQALTIAIRPTRKLWVTGTADGQRVLYRMLQPGEEVTLEAQERLTFRLGDAGAFEYALNGVPRKPPGRDGEVRELVITHDTLR